MSYFDFTGKTKVVDGVTVHQIIATADIPHLDVFAGDTGGYVQHRGNLANQAWAEDLAVIMGNALADDGALVCRCSCIRDNAYVAGGVVALGDSCIEGNACVIGGTDDDRTLITIDIMDNVVIGGNARVVTSKEDDLYFSDDVVIMDNAVVTGDGAVCGDTIIKDNSVVVVHGTIEGRSTAMGNAVVNCAEGSERKVVVEATGNQRLIDDDSTGWNPVTE